MASSSGSGSTGSLSTAGAAMAMAAASGTEEEMRALMEQRRAKRMLSNRESARRSRMRKQRHLDDLAAQAAHLRRENAHVAAALGLTARGLQAVDAENAVLRTQAAELAARLHSLNDIIACMSANNNTAAAVALTVAAAATATTADPLLGGFDGASFEDFLFRSSPEMFMFPALQS
ncbi:bZIP transcription factor 11-like [Triticum dicoccoides]|uniref:bZIP transcription factor 11-like n=1 Tax=Triticum dicoccoides TaxID=85692 RepID=UPI000E7A07CC|nr:bZIP transcription factor 11-like [Triticum dicoccoides]